MRGGELWHTIKMPFREGSAALEFPSDNGNLSGQPFVWVKQKSGVPKGQLGVRASQETLAGQFIEF